MKEGGGGLVAGLKGLGIGSKRFLELERRGFEPQLSMSTSLHTELRSSSGFQKLPKDTKGLPPLPSVSDQIK